MSHSDSLPLIVTVSDRCRMCYTCVRECPAKAIRVADGQAQVITDRCIGCGNCVRVCSQGAKQAASSIQSVEELLAFDSRVTACLAPSFPAERLDADYRRVVGMVRALGFEYVNEVAFGADLVAAQYRKLLSVGEQEHYIATTCPALVGYVERYCPALVGALAPIVSPMIATARALHRLHGSDLKMVFIGPCIGKKGEAATGSVAGEVDAVLTFVELREMLDAKGITADAVEPGEFDPPHAGAGALFSIARGMLQAAEISEDLMIGEVVAAEGRTGFVDALKEFESGDLNARLLEVLCCNGCIMGSGMSCDVPSFRRRSRVSRYARERYSTLDRRRWRRDIVSFTDLDLSREFGPYDQRIAVPATDELTGIMHRMGKFEPADELNCGACGYDTCREHAIAVYKGLAESEMCLPHTIDQLRSTIGELALSHEQLADTQEALMHSERLASMGQLAAGIAHEVNNPLGVVLMYSHLLLDECKEAPGLRDDLKMIVEQADRCKKIVAGLLHFARQNKLVLEPVDVCDLADRCIKTMPVPESIRIETQHACTDPIAELDKDQTLQVLTNLITNAVAAMPDGGSVTVATDDDPGHIRVTVTDTGVGIPKANIGKVFEPFFTTKQIGKGTGLGLAVTYGIVKMHSGQISVESNTDPSAGPTGTTFTVTLPRNAGDS